MKNCKLMNKMLGAGAIAACMYPIPDEIVSSCNRILTDDLREINNQFVMLLKQRVSA